MKLESQVCSLELAQKLKELGVKQESYFHYTPIISSTWDDKEEAHVRKITYMLSCQIATSEHSVATFTVAELGEMMKEIDEETPWWANGSWWYWGKVEKGKNMGRNIEIEVPTTEADARAKCLIYLLENKIITPNKEDK